MDIKVGAVYPQIELGGDPDAVRTIGDGAEALGFDHLLAYDHVLGAVHADRTPPLTGPYTEDDPFHDPFMLFAYLAGRTERIEFVSGVLILPQRQTALVAKQAADLAVLSGNRFRLGVGVGWNHVEYDALGQDFGTRGRREEEQIILLRKYWSEHVVTFDGEFDSVDRAGVLPRPTKPIEIWLGGFSSPAFHRAGRVGDGFLFGGPLSTVVHQMTVTRGHAHDAGRGGEPFGAEWMSFSNKGAADHAAKIERWAQAGGTHATVVTMNLGLDSAQAHLDYLGQVADLLGLGGRL
jgi:probable F420-dependent oxidoreductase